MDLKFPLPFSQFQGFISDPYQLKIHISGRGGSCGVVHVGAVVLESGHVGVIVLALGVGHLMADVLVLGQGEVKTYKIVSVT